MGELRTLFMYWEIAVYDGRWNDAKKIERQLVAMTGAENMREARNVIIAQLGEPTNGHCVPAEKA